MTPLHHLLVIDCSRILAGPHAGMILAELGAEVIKVEQPGGDPARNWVSGRGASHTFLGANRSKKSIVLDLQTEAGRADLHKLAATADILIHNHSPLHVEKLGLDSIALRHTNPRLVVVSCTGYGATGPLHARRVYDPIIQAESGLMDLTGDGAEPTRSGIIVSDYVASLWVALAALAASSSGKGAFIDFSMFEGQMALMNNSLTAAALSGEPARGEGNYQSHWQLAANFQCFDGRWVHIVATEQDQWEALCRATGHPGWLESYPDMKSRCEGRRNIIDRLNRWTLQRTSDEVIDLLAPVKVPVGKVNRLDEAMDHPQVLYRNAVDSFEYPGVGMLPFIRLPFLMHGLDMPKPKRPPLVNEHEDEIRKQYLD